MNPGDWAAWLATAIFPATAIAGLLLRRFAAGSFAIRLRPHFVLGYAVFGFALLHVAFAMTRMQAIGRTDVWLATLALLGLTLQIFLGMSLQAPGVYRRSLRRCHTATMWTVAVLIAAHIALTL